VHEVKALLGLDVPSGMIPVGLAACADVVSFPSAGNHLGELLRTVAAEGAEIGVLVGRETTSKVPVEVLSREVGAMASALREVGSRLAQVKLGGKLHRICEESSAAAEDCVDWMYAEAEGVYLVVPAGGLLHAVAEARGVPLRREIVADRLYVAEAKLAPGDADGDVSAAVERIRDWKATERLRLAGGGEWLVEAELVSLSAETSQSLALARSLRDLLG
jgi:lactam utilization protein B